MVQKIFTSKNFFCLLQTRKFWLDPKLPLISNSYILTKECNCFIKLNCFVDKYSEFSQEIALPAL